ncbi:MAG: CYTH domain-containing protein [Amphibacillus sp.]|nr:CYTH domain-containing protein [Amphibacillus sp.]
MQQEMEFEAKNMLTEQEYNRVLNYFIQDQAQVQTQINYYFETDDLALRHHGSALRIREKNGQYVITLKQPQADGLLETHVKISAEIKDQWIYEQPTRINQLEVILNQLGIDYQTLKYRGKLKTERIELNDDDITYVLDKSYYNGEVDYEIEVEATSLLQANSKLADFLTKYNIERKTTNNKIARFFQTLGA